MPLALNIIIMIVVMVVLIHLSGWFSGSETAITNLSSARIADMRKRNDKNAKFVLELKRNMDRTLITILIGNNIVNIVLSSIAALFANALFHTIGVSIMVGIITFLIIIFGEISPKSYAIMNSEKVSLKNARILHFLLRLLAPFITIFTVISKQIIRLKGEIPKQVNLLVSDESIKGVATLGESEGVIKSIEKEIIHKVLTFGDRKIKDVMVPMDEVFSLTTGSPLSDVVKTISEHGFTRVPVVDENGTIKGIVHSKDLLEQKNVTIESIMRPVCRVSAEQDVTDIFEAMKKERSHIAVVNDDQNHPLGIVTMEDMLEELVGDIYDEHYAKKYKRT